MTSLQFNISDLYDDVNINISDICKKTGIQLNNNLQSYQNIPMKQLFRIFDIESIPSDYFGTTDIFENSLDKVSQRLYRNPSYWWLILLVNNIRNPFSFNMSPRLLAVVANHLYTKEGKYTESAYFDLLNEYNDTNKKNIKYVYPRYLNDFFRKVLS